MRVYKIGLVGAFSGFGGSDTEISVHNSGIWCCGIGVGFLGVSVIYSRGVWFYLVLDFLLIFCDFRLCMFIC